MEFVIGIITYKKHDKIQLLESPLLDSIAHQRLPKEYAESIKLVVNINSKVTENELSELEDRLMDLKVKYSIIGGIDAIQVPKARNELLETVAFENPHCPFFMPDDDDKFFDSYALLAMMKAVEIYGLEMPIATAFNGLRGDTMPNNRRVYGDPEDVYQECNGYFNWNFIFDINWFIKHRISFPEFLDPPHRSHDTLTAVKMATILKNKKIVFLTNCIMDYKYPEGAGTLSTKTKRPDSPLFDEMEYLYSDNHMMKVGLKVFYDVVTNEMVELTEDEYRGLRFRDQSSKDSISKILSQDCEGMLVDFMGRVHIDTLIGVKYDNFNGRDYVWIQKGELPPQPFLLDKYGMVKDLKSDHLFKRYISKELPESQDFDNYLYISVK
jgi:hypothetical protein